MSGTAPHADPDASTPQLVTVKPVSTAVIRGIIPIADLPNFFDSSFSTLPEVIAAQNVTTASPAFALHRRPPGETADLEVGFATNSPVHPDGEVMASSLPGGRIARLIHFGGFDGLGTSWERLVVWVQEHRMTPGEVFWEVYLTEPSPDMDPAELRTELNLPVRD